MSRSTDHPANRRYDYVRRCMDTMRTEREVLTVPEVAGYLGIGTTKCWELVNSGSIPSFRPGGRLVRVRKTELVEWMEQLEKETIQSLDSLGCRQ
jgi:excisionase family DNA binding protein